MVVYYFVYFVKQKYRLRGGSFPGIWMVFLGLNSAGAKGGDCMSLCPDGSELLLGDRSVSRRTNAPEDLS